MIIVPLPRWPDYFPRVSRRPRPAERTWAGRRLLALDEQLEIGRRYRDGESAPHLSRRYGVSVRTIYRYVRRPHSNHENVLRGRLFEWARERDLTLSRDDMDTLVALLSRHFESAA